MKSDFPHGGNVYLLKKGVFMIIMYKGKICLFIAAAVLTACASKPPKVQDIPTTADASTELEVTQKMLNEAKENNLDILAPKNYKRAQESLSDARGFLVKGKSKEKVLENLAESRGWLAEAQSRGDITRAAAKGLSDARSGAMNANAPLLYPKEFKKIEDQTRDLAEEAEKGDLEKVTKEGDKVTQAYHKLEVDAVTKNLLGEAQINLEAAKKDGATKTSPKTFSLTEAKLNTAISMIQENPRNTKSIGKASADATEQSKILLFVNEKTKAGNTEDLVLQSEKQRRQISGLTTEYAHSEAELSEKEAELAKKNAARVAQSAKAERGRSFRRKQRHQGSS
jgi:hypothetical protein